MNCSVYWLYKSNYSDKMELKEPSPEMARCEDEVKNLVTLKGNHEDQDLAGVQRHSGANSVPAEKERNGLTSSEESAKRETIGVILHRVEAAAGPAPKKLDNEVSETAHGIQAQFVIEKASILCSESKYSDAAMLLDKPFVPGSDLFMSRLLLVECYMRLGDLHRATPLIESVSDVVISSGLGPREVKAHAEYFRNESFYTRAILFFRIASELFARSSLPPDEVVSEIASCLSQICSATTPMVEEGGKSFELGIEYGIGFMTDILSVLSEVKNASRHKTAEAQASSCGRIGLSFFVAKKFRKCIEYCKAGEQILSRQVGHDGASKFKVHALLLHKIARSLDYLNKLADAEPYYARALKAISVADDFISAYEREKFSSVVKSDLDKVKAKLGSGAKSSNVH